MRVPIETLEVGDPFETLLTRRPGVILAKPKHEGIRVQLGRCPSGRLPAQERTLCGGVIVRAVL